MKPSRVITPHTGSAVRLYPEGVVMGDIPTGRTPAFLHQLMKNSPELQKHVIKMDVDGLVFGHRVGYVMDVEGVETLIQIPQGISPRAGRQAATKASITWIQKVLLWSMLSERDDNPCRELLGAITLKSPDVDGVAFHTPILDPDTLITIKANDVRRILSFRDLVKQLGMLR